MSPLVKVDTAGAVVTDAIVVDVTALDEDSDAFSEASRTPPPSVPCSVPVGDRDSEIAAADVPDDGSPVCSGVALAKGEGRQRYKNSRDALTLYGSLYGSNGVFFLH